MAFDSQEEVYCIYREKLLNYSPQNGLKMDTNLEILFSIYNYYERTDLIWKNCKLNYYFFAIYLKEGQSKN